MTDIPLSRKSSHEAFAEYNSYNIFEREIGRSDLVHTEIKTVYRERIRLYKGLFTILFVTTFITLFELVFYILVIYPRIRSGILAFVDYETDKYTQYVIDTLRRREDILIYKIQQKSYVAIAVLILSMVCALIALYTKIHSLHKQDFYYTDRKSKLNFTDVIFYSFVTIFILVLYQIIFYNFGVNYEYITPEEILYKILIRI